MSKSVGTVLAYAANVSGVLSFPLAVVAAWLPARKWLQEHRHRSYRPRHARSRPAVDRGEGG